MNESKKEKTPAAPSEAETLRRIREGLSTLHLARMQQSLDEILASPPREEPSRTEWLWRVLEPQVRERLEGRVERKIRESRLPVRKTLEAFDFDFQPTLDRDLVLELATLRFIDRGANVLLAGMSGTGKSHIAMALALAACADNRRVRYTTSAQMLSTLNAALADESLESALRPYTQPDLLVIDEVGLEQVERSAASRAGLMQKVLLPRHERRSTIVTSNIDWDSWGDYLGDHLGAAALIDRLIHHSHVIVINGPSYRDHEHRKDVEQGRKGAPKEGAAKDGVDPKGRQRATSKSKRASCASS